MTATLETSEYCMSQENNSEPSWGRLLPLGDGFSILELKKGTYTFGRADDVDCSFKLNQHQHYASISKLHFRIHRETSSVGNHTFIEDLSSNGTFVNKEKIGKTKRRILNSGDEIAIATPTLSAFVYVENDLKPEENLPDELAKKYIICRVLGRGAMGEVRLAFEKETCQRVAVKIIQKHKLLSQGKPTSDDVMKGINREINILKKVDYPCIIGVREVFDNDEMAVIVLELADGGELFDRIVSGPGRLEEDVAKFYFYQIVLAVNYLHDMDITHRDLKPENILLASSSTETLIKISDFGMSKIVDGTTLLQTVCGTPIYLAPEIVKTAGIGSYTKAVDLWSMGVVLFIALAGYPPFSSEYKDMPLRDQIINGRYRFINSRWESISSDAIDLVKRLLTVDPNSRITLSETLEHPWLQDQEIRHKVELLMYPDGLTSPKSIVAYNHSSPEIFEIEMVLHLSDFSTAKSASLKQLEFRDIWEI